MLMLSMWAAKPRPKSTCFSYANLFTGLEGKVISSPNLRSFFFLEAACCINLKQKLFSFEDQIEVI